MLQMKILLVSPVDSKKPGKAKFLTGGENTYTRTLLKNPPPKVKYIHYSEALKKGLIETTPLQTVLTYLIKFRILPLSPRILCFKIKSHFDLIHAHAHAIKISGIKTPIILSDSSSNIVFLRYYLGWSDIRVKLTYFLKKTLEKSLGIYDQELNPQESLLMVWSNSAKKIKKDFGIEEKKIFVIPPGIEKPKIKKKKNQKKNSIHILFIGIWFKRKGGHLLVKAFESLKQKYPTLKLTLIGSLPKGFKLSKDIIHKPYINRRDLISQIYPDTDILVLVPETAEGYGMVLLEASFFKIPAIVSSIFALPEIVDHNKTGIVITPGSIKELSLALSKLIKNPIFRAKLGENARRKYLNQFWVKQTNKELLKAYQESLK